MDSLSSYSNVTTADCENILSIIQKEFELQKKNHEHISKIQEEIVELTAQRNILSKQKKFNEKWCILCYSSLLFRRKIQCPECHFWVCRSKPCASWDDQYKGWICKVCEKQRYLDAESWAWFYNQLRLKFNHFGSAKVLENLCQRKKLLDSENDSGYGPSCDYKSLLSLFSSNSKQISSMADCEDDEDEEEVIGEEEEEETEIRHSIEYIVSGLLGSTLDDASVDRMYADSDYERIFSTYHSQLINAIQNLSNSLRRALHNLPHADGISPTVALASLKHLITTVDKECSSLPLLQTSPKNETDYDLNSNCSMSLVDGDIFSSYEGLVASAIINKVVEDNQIKYLKQNGSSYLQKDENNDEDCNESCSSKIERENTFGETLQENHIENDSGSQGFTEEQLPLECVQIEEVEEITREYTDSDDDRFSSVSHQSSCMQSTDKLSMERRSSEIDFLYSSEQPSDGKTPFPEFGPDLVDDIEKVEESTVCYPVAVTSWEENWLFRKKRRLPLYSNLKYQLLTYCDEPPCMLIPCPSDSSTTLDKEGSLSSELSETHSVGSLEFSSEGETRVSCSSSQDLKSSPKSHSEETLESITSEEAKAVISDKTYEPKFSNNSNNKSDMGSFSDVKIYPQADISVENGTANEYEFHESDLRENFKQDHSNSILSKVSDNEHASHWNKTTHETPEREDKMDSGIDGIFPIPTQPGTIAEREHKKWLNAIPLKNNPYSAENIYRRNSTHHKPVILNSAASFKEFEKQMSHMSPKEPLQTRLNCGLKSIDGNLYKRDYYINQFDLNNQEKSHKHIVSLPNFESFNDSSEGIPEEALNSLEEKVYISAGKVFTLENHVKRLERELKDMCLLSQDRQSLPSSVNFTSEMDINTDKIKKKQNCTFEDKANLPSVKVLATKFIPSKKEKPVVVS